jgi:hypothetical protein
MSNLVQDTLLAHLPTGTRPKPTGRGLIYTFNCPACHLRGEPSRDKGRRGNVFVNHDGSLGYYCHRCQLRTVQRQYQPLTQNMKLLLSYLGMSDEELTRLNFHVGAQRRTIEHGFLQPITVTPKPLPNGAKLIGDWIASPISNANLLAVLDDLDDMTANCGGLTLILFL